MKSAASIADLCGPAAKPAGDVRRTVIVLILGIETSCDETGVALYDTGATPGVPARGLLAHALHSQVAMHADYGGVVPELASRDHIRRVLPLVHTVLRDSAAQRGGHRRQSPTPRAPAWPARCWSAPPSPAAWPSRSAFRPSAFIIWKRICSRRCCLATRRAFRSSPCWCPVDILSSCGSTASAATPCSAKHSTTRPAKRSTRPRNCSDSAIPAGRRSRDWRSAATRNASSCRGRC